MKKNEKLQVQRDLSIIRSLQIKIFCKVKQGRNLSTEDFSFGTSTIGTMQNNISKFPNDGSNKIYYLLNQFLINKNQFQEYLLLQFQEHVRTGSLNTNNNALVIIVKLDTLKMLDFNQWLGNIILLQFGELREIFEMVTIDILKSLINIEETYGTNNIFDIITNVRVHIRLLSIPYPLCIPFTIKDLKKRNLKSLVSLRGRVTSVLKPIFDAVWSQTFYCHSQASNKCLGTKPQVLVQYMEDLGSQVLETPTCKYCCLPMNDEDISARLFVPCKLIAIDISTTFDTHSIYDNMYSHMTYSSYNSEVTIRLVDDFTMHHLSVGELVHILGTVANEVPIKTLIPNNKMFGSIVSTVLAIDIKKCDQLLNHNIIFENQKNFNKSICVIPPNACVTIWQFLTQAMNHMALFSTVYNSFNMINLFVILGMISYRQRKALNMTIEITSGCDNVELIINSACDIVKQVHQTIYSTFISDIKPLKIYNNFTDKNISKLLCPIYQYEENNIDNTNYSDSRDMADDETSKQSIILRPQQFIVMADNQISNLIRNSNSVDMNMNMHMNMNISNRPKLWLLAISSQQPNNDRSNGFLSQYNNVFKYVNSRENVTTTISKIIDSTELVYAYKENVIDDDMEHQIIKNYFNHYYSSREGLHTNMEVDDNFAYKSLCEIIRKSWLHDDISLPLSEDAHNLIIDYYVASRQVRINCINTPIIPQTIQTIINIAQCLAKLQPTLSMIDTSHILVSIMIIEERIASIYGHSPLNFKMMSHGSFNIDFRSDYNIRQFEGLVLRFCQNHTRTNKKRIIS